MSDEVEVCELYFRCRDCKRVMGDFWYVPDTDNCSECAVGAETVPSPSPGTEGKTEP